MKGRLFNHLSANTLQLVVNQVFGLVVVNLLSVYLSKEAFGELNLALAVLLAAFSILSLGIDQLVVRKIAAGANLHDTIQVYLCHTLIGGAVFYLLAGGCYLLFPAVRHALRLVLLLGIGKCMLFFSSPFKQAANGMERFRLLASLSTIANTARVGGLLLFAWRQPVTLEVVVVIFICSDVLELLAGAFLFFTSTRFSLNITWRPTAYLQLLREAIPQAGVVVMTSFLARFDWILIGATLPAAYVAEYSFAYKVFELSGFPLLVIAPLLVPRFTAWATQGRFPVKTMVLLLRVELLIAIFTGLLLVMAWVPVIDWLTQGKYGVVNAGTILVLALSIPFIYLNNFMWSLYFAQRQLKWIFRTFLATVIVNVLFCLLLVPAYKNEGAAIALLASGMAQSGLFLSRDQGWGGKAALPSLFICLAGALFSGLIARCLVRNEWLAIAAASGLFLLFTGLTRQLRKSDLRAIRRILTS